MSKVHHMVLLKFKASADPQTPNKLFTALEGLKKIMPGMLYFRGGPNNSSEGLTQGLTHGFLMTFQDAAARDHYLVHPDHEKVKGDFFPTIDNIVVFDFAE